MNAFLRIDNVQRIKIDFDSPLTWPQEARQIFQGRFRIAGQLASHQISSHLRKEVGRTEQLRTLHLERSPFEPSIQMYSAMMDWFKPLPCSSLRYFCNCFADQRNVMQRRAREQLTFAVFERYTELACVIGIVSKAAQGRVHPSSKMHRQYTYHSDGCVSGDVSTGWMSQDQASQLRMGFAARETKRAAGYGCYESKVRVKDR